MKKKFTVDERNKLKSNIINFSKDLYIQQGTKGLDIRSIASANNISTGMFYKLFPSKESLLKELITIEVSKGQRQIEEAVIEYKDNPIQALRTYLMTIQTCFYENKFLSKVRIEDIHYLAELKAASEINQNSIDFIEDICTYWQENHSLEKNKLLLTMESIRAISMLWFHQQEIGVYYQSIIDHICDTLLQPYIV